MSITEDFEELKSLINSALKANWRMWGKPNHNNKEEYTKFLRDKNLVDLAEGNLGAKLYSMEENIRRIETMEKKNMEKTNKKKSFNEEAQFMDAFAILFEKLGDKVETQPNINKEMKKDKEY